MSRDRWSKPESNRKLNGKILPRYRRWFSSFYGHGPNSVSSYAFTNYLCFTCGLVSSNTNCCGKATKHIGHVVRVPRKTASLKTWWKFASRFLHRSDLKDLKFLQ